MEKSLESGGGKEDKQINTMEGEQSRLQEGARSSSSKTARTYEKLAGTVDQGREYEQIMCAFYALKLIANDEVEDFEMTTNQQGFGTFDDIVLKVTFKDKKERTFLFQLKHKEAAKRLRKVDLRKGKHDFDVGKYCTSINENIETSEDIICVLYTNCPLDLKNSTEIETNINIERCPSVEFEDLLSNKELQKVQSVFRVTQNSEDKNCKFYLFSEQGNLTQTQLYVEKMLKYLLRYNIYDSFTHFISQWWSKNFVLSKDDVIAKLIELALSPHTKTLTSNKQNDKTQYLKAAIMNFQITIVKKPDEEIVENIWPNQGNTTDECGKIKQKFAIWTNEETKISWYLNKAPLIVRVKDGNRFIIKTMTKLMKKATDNRKLILIGNVARSNFEGMEVFQNLSDLITKSKDTEHCQNILRTFTISIQGREPISLERLVNIDNEIARHIGLEELFVMSQAKYVSENKKDLPEFHIPRNVSSIFVKRAKITSIYELLKDQTMIIINCDSTFKDKLTFRNFHILELSDYLNKGNNKHENVVIVSIKSRCTPKEFKRICEKSGKRNVYLLQTFDDDCCVLLSKKGKKIPGVCLDESKKIKEEDVLNHFDGPLNTVCAPPGMGKSTLMKVLYNNCPSDYWGVYVELIHCNPFFGKQRSSEEIEKYFLDFAEKVSSEGMKVWISCRENLRDKIDEKLNVVSIEILQLDQQQQKQYVHKKLKSKYRKEEIEKILQKIFDSTDLNNSQDLLGIPLQLYIITEMFLHNNEAFKNLDEENIFVLTYMYKVFFEGKIATTIEKLVDKEQKNQLGFIKALLKPYEVVALKVCLDNKDFEVLDVNLQETKEFIEEIKLNGDKSGIIKKIGDNDEVIFIHQTYAEYFAAIWLKTNKKKASLLKQVVLSERYDNLRLMFDVMLADNKPLHLSIIYKNMNKFEQHVEESDAKDAGGRTPLQLLCTYGMRYPVKTIRKNSREPIWYMTMMEALTQEGVNIDGQDDLFKFSCVDYALEAKCLYPIEIFLKRELSTFANMKEKIFHYYKEEPLIFYAAQLGYSNLFSAIIAESPELVNVKICNEYLLQTAVTGTPDDNVVPPRDGNIAVVNAIFEYKFDMNKNISDIVILDVACKSGKYDMLKILLGNGAKCFEGNTIWHALAQSRPKSCEELKLLENIAPDVDVNAKNDKGITALHLGSVTGNYEIVKFLLANGAKPNIVDADGNNPLHYVSWNRDSWDSNQDKIKLLINKGINLNAPTKNGSTALQFACEYGDYEITKMLLENHASTNILDKDNNNALHYAARSWECNREIIKLLIEEGIDVRTPNNERTTAFELACEHDDSEIREMLVKCLRK
ncbi:hypothetical protein Zmor_018967 [Zophobas morio]|uniref:Uncharacterized protein n=1 Tax=Zophobas morio TaxID=2755281 RepID=A0AA38MEN0_9CUCU|nr:hypothetical protein Zmor_018967 [Zophobas morio]